MPKRRTAQWTVYRGEGDYDVAPGMTAAEGFVVGRPRLGDGFTGPAQDVAAYSMMIPVRQN